MKPAHLLPLLVSLLVLVAGCGAASLGGRPTTGLSAPPAIAPAAAPTSAPAMRESAGAGQSKDSGGTASNGDALPAAADVNRMVVYTGSIQLEVKDTADTVNQIESILRSTQGYISVRSLSAYGENKLRGTITIRVPAASLDNVLTQIKALGLRVLREDSKSDDVTQEYTDLDARRRNLEAYEVELTKLLETVRESTGKAEDILAVYNQLTEVRGQIEQIKGRQNYLQNTSTLATYTIEFVPKEEVTVVEAGWDPNNTARSALRNLVQTLQALADVGITVILWVLPTFLLLLLPFVVLFLIARWLIRRRAVRRPVAA